MAFIDPDGLFSGDRFSLVSDNTRFAWPYLWCASNSVGRVELSYQKIVDRAFRCFRKKPTEDTFWGWVRELQEAYLLFVYEVDGQIWGQWHCSEEYLPKYKLARDIKTPPPHGPTFCSWKDRYVELKSKSNAVNLSENFQKVLEVSKTFPMDRRGLERIGKEKTPTQKPRGVVTSISKPKASPRTPEIQSWFDQEFWPIYPRKAAKEKARDAAEKRATTPELRAAIIRAVNHRLPEFSSREESRIPHPASWLNSEGFDDFLKPSRDGPKERAGYNQPADLDNPFKDLFDLVDNPRGKRADERTTQH